MILFPAIDLKDGQAVRLLRGHMASATVFNEDPAAQARSFADDGFQWVHLVDLNGPLVGRPVNAPAVGANLAAVDLPAQLATKPAVRGQGTAVAVVCGGCWNLKK